MNKRLQCDTIRPGCSCYPRCLASIKTSCIGKQATYKKQPLINQKLGVLLAWLPSGGWSAADVSNTSHITHTAWVTSALSDRLGASRLWDFRFWRTPADFVDRKEHVIIESNNVKVWRQRLLYRTASECTSGDLEKGKRHSQKRLEIQRSRTVNNF